jgi:hypothetical protein
MRVLCSLTESKFRASLFWDITPRRWVIGARDFETAFWFPLQGLRSTYEEAEAEDRNIMLSENVTSHPATRPLVPEYRRPQD